MSSDETNEITPEEAVAITCRIGAGIEYDWLLTCARVHRGLGPVSVLRKGDKADDDRAIPGTVPANDAGPNE